MWFWESIVALFSYLAYYDHFITKCNQYYSKCNSYFIKKCDKSWLQNASDFLLQNATTSLQNTTVVTKCIVYNKMCQYIVRNGNKSKPEHEVKFKFVMYCFIIESYLIYRQKSLFEVLIIVNFLKRKIRKCVEPKFRISSNEAVP